MGEIGIVTARMAQEVEVTFERSAACENCKACMIGGSNEMKLYAQNRCDAQVGDTVEIALGEGYFAKASLIVYGFPLLMMLGGFFAGQGIAELIHAGEFGDLWSFAVGIVMMIASYVLLRARERKKWKDGYKPLAVKIIQSPIHPNV